MALQIEINGVPPGGSSTFTGGTVSGPTTFSAEVQATSAPVNPADILRLEDAVQIPVYIVTSGQPATGVGQNGDWAIDPNTGISYLNTSGTWTSQGVIVVGEGLSSAQSTLPSNQTISPGGTTTLLTVTVQPGIYVVTANCLLSYTVTGTARQCDLSIVADSAVIASGQTATTVTAVSGTNVTVPVSLNTEFIVTTGGTVALNAYAATGSGTTWTALASSVVSPVAGATILTAVPVTQ
jgi:hypothetical protein